MAVSNRPQRASRCRLEVSIPNSRPAVLATALLLVAGAALASPSRGDWRSIVAPSPPATEPSLAELKRLLADERLRLVDLEAADGVTLPDADPSPLIALLGGRQPCGTLAARAAASVLAEGSVVERRRLELERLLDRPNLAAASTMELESLILEWDSSVNSRHALSGRDANSNGTPDRIEAAAADLRHALQGLTERLGLGPAWERPLRVVLGASEWTQGRVVESPSGRHLLLPRGLGGEDRLRAAAHQLAHVLLSELAPGAPLGWEEAAATFLAESIVAEATGVETSPQSLLPPTARDDGRAHPRRALGSPGLAACRGDAAFLAFVDARFGLGAGWLADLWSDLSERLARDGHEGASGEERAEQLALESLDGLLGRGGSDLSSAVAEYLGWSLESDLLAGRPVSVDARLSRLPSTESLSGTELPPFGQLRFEVEVPTDGGLRLVFESDGRAEAEVFALLQDGELARRPLSVSAWGERSLRLPAGRLVAVVVLVSAPMVPTDLGPWREGASVPAPGDFRLNLEREVGYPFVLQELASEARVGQVRIDWMSSSEEDLVAWHVEKARRLAGPWRRVTGVPVPPSARPDAAWSYSVVDSDVLASTRYHYRLVAVTASGLLERSPSVSVLTLPESPELDAEASR